MKPDPRGQPAITTWKVMGRDTSRCKGEVAEGSETGGGDDYTSSAAPSGSPHPGGFAAHPPLAGDGKHTWLALEPLTGRTHQLRVHCAAMGWPVVGDAIYGTAPRVGAPMLHLHAREIEVPLYKNREPIRVTAPVPLHMQERLYACGWQGEIYRLV